VQGDLAELWAFDLGGRPVAMTPFCQADPNPDTTGFRFWSSGFWKTHLGEQPYHISALQTLRARTREPEPCAPEGALHKSPLPQRHVLTCARSTRASRFVVDLQQVRTSGVANIYRDTYQSLTADPSSLSNLDQDLPNYLQHAVPMRSLPEEWLWCAPLESEAAATTAVRSRRTTPCWLAPPSAGARRGAATPPSRTPRPSTCATTR
jgi:UDP-glucose:glycoprotein glucosyltransferase